MRLAPSLLAISVLLITASSTMSDEKQGSPIGSQPKQRYTVLCRWIKQDDELLACPALTLSDGENGSISETSQSAFVTGITRVTNPSTKAFAQRPYIVVLDEGMKIDLIVAGRQPEGATVDVTVEQLKITRVDVKECSPGSFVQVPSVDIGKKRVFDFVKFGEALVVPLGEKHADGTMPRLEIVVGVGENIRPHWTSHTMDRLVTPSDAERNDIFDTILATGAAKVFCQRVSRWEKIQGHDLATDFGLFRTLCDYAGIWSYCPHQFGAVDVLAMLSPSVHDPVRVRELEEAVFGCVPGYSTELCDSPSLLKNVELLSRLPWLWDVTIRTQNADEQLLQTVKRLHVLHHLEICKMADSGGCPIRPQGASVESQPEGKTQFFALKFEGPFGYNQSLPLENRKDSPVKIASIAFPEKDLGNYLLIDFSFNGKTDRERKIDLTVTGRDSAGNVIIHNRVLCHDARIPTTTKPTPGSQPDIPFLTNNQTFSLNHATPQQIALLEITFAEPIPPLHNAIASMPAEKLVIMGGVTPRIIIQEEPEDEHLEVPLQP